MVPREHEYTKLLGDLFMDEAFDDTYPAPCSGNSLTFVSSTLMQSGAFSDACACKKLLQVQAEIASSLTGCVPK